MHPAELRQLLHERAAGEFFAPLDPERILDAAHARRVRRHRAAASVLAFATAAGVFAALAAGGPSGTGNPDRLVPLATATTTVPSPAPSASASALMPTVATPTPAAPPAGWISAPAFPRTDISAGATRVGSRIVYWGGPLGPDDARTYSDHGTVFDVPGRTWSTMAASPLAARAGMATAGSERLFFLWGGYGDRQRAFDDGAIYDPSLNAWTTIARGPLTAQPTLGTVWNGAEFVVVTAVARGDKKSTSLAAAYNPSTNSWRRLPALPSGLTSASVLVVSGRIVVLGANLDTNNAGTNIGYALTPGESAWRDFASPPIEPQTITAATDGTYLYAVGRVGSRPGPYPVGLSFQRFTFAAGVWDARPAPPVREVECDPHLAMATTKVFLTYCSGNAFFDRPGQFWTPAPDLGIGRPVAVGTELVFPDATRTLIYVGG